MKIRFFLLLLLLTLAACAPTSPSVRVLWPVPPDEPRLEFIAGYASEGDFPQTAWQKFSESIFGKTPHEYFKMPMDAVLDSRGRAYISDIYLGNVRVYDFEARTNHILTSDTAALVQPVGLAIDSHDRLYVADIKAGQIVVFGPDHEVLRTIRHADLAKPAYLFVDDSKDRLYVTDGKESKVLIFDLSGKLLKTFGQGKIFFPQGIAVSSDGRIFVAEALMARLSIFSPEGEFLRFYGERGDGPGQFDNPKDIAFGPEGMLYVLDARKPSLIIFDKDLQALLALGGERGIKSKLALDSPSGLFVSAGGRILITDRLTRSFAIWQYLTPEYLAEHPITATDLQRIEAATKGQGEAGAAKEAPEKKK